MNIFSRLSGWFGRFGAIGDGAGVQSPVPGASLVDNVANVGVDGALQISTVWACIDRRATILASLPFFVYKSVDGKRELARTSRLFELLHDSPNPRMTPFEFWRAMVLNHDLRGNAYARIDRDVNGEALAMWPMPADQVEVTVLPDGEVVYQYTYDNDVAVLASASVLHIKNLGNGTTGMAKLEFMRPATDEVAKSQAAASKVFATGGKPTGILMIDKVLSPEQRASIRSSFQGLVEGATSRLLVLEANMKYQQVSMSPEDQELLATRHFGVEELCRWLDVPPVLVHHSNVTAWGTGIFEIKDGFYTLALAPLCVNIQQAVRKRVMTSRQRASMTAEFSMDAMLRASIKDRYEIYAKAAQNGLKTRNECRQLENDPPVAGGDDLTVQSNLLPIALLGAPAPAASPPDDAEKSIRRLEIQIAEQKAELLAARNAPKETKAPVFNATVHLTQGEIRNEFSVPQTEIKQDVHHHHQTTVQGASITLPAPIVRNEITVDPTPVTLEATIKNEMPAYTETRIVGMPQRQTASSVTRDQDGNIVNTTQLEKDV